MSCRNLQGLPERRSISPVGLEPESEIPCIDPSGGWFRKKCVRNRDRVWTKRSSVEEDELVEDVAQQDRDGADPEVRSAAEERSLAAVPSRARQTSGRQEALEARKLVWLEMAGREATGTTLEIATAASLKLCSFVHERGG